MTACRNTGRRAGGMASRLAIPRGGMFACEGCDFTTCAAQGGNATAEMVSADGSCLSGKRPQENSPVTTVGDPRQA